MILSARIQPETREERVIRLDFLLGRRSLSKSRAGRVIDGDQSFNDQTELTSQIARVTEGDAFPTANGRDVDTRFKRQVSRRRRDCDLSAKHCEMLLQAVQNYLVALARNKLSMTNDEKSLSTDILKCLECKKLMNGVDEDEDYTPRSKDQYFPHDYAEQNSSSDFGTAVIKLLDDGKVGNGSKRTEVNRTEATKIQLETNTVTDNPSQNSTNQSSKDISILETTTVLIDHTDSNGSQRINDSDVNNSDINDKQTDSNPAANDLRIIKVQDDESIPVTSKIDQQHVIIESKDVTNVTLWFTTESSKTRTQYSAITGDDEHSGKTTIAADSIGTTTETTTRIIADLTKQITGNMTSVLKKYDVTGIDGETTMHPSVRPSFEGHQENRSAATTNGTWSKRIRK